MKIFLKDQKQKFAKHLNKIKKFDLKRFDIRNLKEKYTERFLITDKTLDDLNLDFFFNYDIFPVYIIDPLPEWLSENRSMQIGDTILQQILIPPFKASFKLIMGVRIIDKLESKTICGFSYETLVGHAEIGRANFKLEQHKQGIKIIIHTYSSADQFFAKLLEPIFTSPYQDYCTKKAIDSIKKKLEDQI